MGGKIRPQKVWDSSEQPMCVVRVLEGKERGAGRISLELWPTTPKT